MSFEQREISEMYWANFHASYDALKLRSRVLTAAGEVDPLGEHRAELQRLADTARNLAKRRTRAQVGDDVAWSRFWSQLNDRPRDRPIDRPTRRRMVTTIDGDGVQVAHATRSRARRAATNRPPR